MKEQEIINSDKGSLVKELKDKLDWYTLYASEEEYDEKAVESILYLLERLEPLKKEEEVCADGAWKRFREMVRERGEAQSAGETAGMEAERPESTGGLTEKPAKLAEKRRSAGNSAKRKLSEDRGTKKLSEISEELGISAKNGSAVKETILPISMQENSDSNMSADRKKLGELGSFVLNYKYIAAAAAVLLILSAAGGVQATASPNTGFFHWLKRDNTVTQMVTSPDGLDADVITDVKGVSLHYNREEVPEWAEEWLVIDKEFEMPEGYEWTRFEIEEGRNFHKIASYYLNRAIDKRMLLGTVIYYDKISLNTEGFVDYSYVDSYKIEQKDMYVYSRIEEKGKKCYMIYFYKENCQYFIQGHDNLDELKELMEKYWFYVKNNLEKNEIFCNKMLSQAIYK